MTQNKPWQAADSLLDYTVIPIIGLATLVLCLAAADSSKAQVLGSGDYEICSVHDRQGRFSGYDSVCLETRRAILRNLRHDRLHNGSDPAAYGPYYCPRTANEGRGWSVGGFNSYGPTTPGSGLATMDQPVNGRLCVPRPVGYLSHGYD
jgi:hypothetical protein